MKIYKRLEALEKQLIREPTLLFMPDGKIVSLTGPNDYLLTLVGLATNRERANPRQAAQLDLIQQCSASREPDGAHLVDLIQCFLNGPVDTPYEAGANSPVLPLGDE